jgi:uncharacterized membrane protein/8-oxo-dGTP pyrophosphatase MutT (NUDIX family)
MGIVRSLGRWLLGAVLAFAGIGHLTFARQSFVAQVPQWLPLPVDVVVVASGIVEIVLGLSLILLSRYRVMIGWIVAGFFVAVFPGNIEQFVRGTDAFGLDTDLARGIRLAFQPLLVVWALWSTGAWKAWRKGRHHDVVCAVLIRDGQVLLARRTASNDWYPGVWDLPGGHVESQETGAQALVRELREELGVTITEPGHAPTATLRVDDMALSIWRIDVWVGEPLNCAPEEHDALGWFDLVQVGALDLALDEYRPLLRQLLEGESPRP